MVTFLGHGVTQSDLDETRRKLLNHDETLIAIAPGQLAHQEDAVKTHFVVVTDQRVIFFGRAFLSPTIHSFPLHQIGGVHVQKGLLFATLELNVGGKRESFHWMYKSDTDAIARIINNQLQAPPQPQPQRAQATIIKEKIVEREIILVRCPYCKAKQPDEATFCSHCGAKL